MRSSGTSASADVHVFDAVDDHAAGAEQLGRHFVGVVAAIDRVARDQRQCGRAVRQNFLQTLVVILGYAPADQLALGPAAAAMHRRVDAARVRILAGKTDVVEEVLVGAIVRRVQRLDVDARAVDRALCSVQRWRRTPPASGFRPAAARIRTIAPASGLFMAFPYYSSLPRTARARADSARISVAISSSDVPG